MQINLRFSIRKLVRLLPLPRTNDVDPIRVQRSKQKYIIAKMLLKNSWRKTMLCLVILLFMHPHIFISSYQVTVTSIYLLYTLYIIYIIRSSFPILLLFSLYTTRLVSWYILYLRVWCPKSEFLFIYYFYALSNFWMCEIIRRA